MSLGGGRGAMFPTQPLEEVRGAPGAIQAARPSSRVQPAAGRCCLIGASEISRRACEKVRAWTGTGVATGTVEATAAYRSWHRACLGKAVSLTWSVTANHGHQETMEPNTFAPNSPLPARIHRRRPWDRRDERIELRPHGGEAAMFRMLVAVVVCMIVLPRPSYAVPVVRAADRYDVPGLSHGVS